MSDIKHMINEEDIGSGEDKASESEELIAEIKKIPVNGGAPVDAQIMPAETDAEKTEKPA